MKRRDIKENFILRLEMVILLTISLIAVTIAWFVLSNYVRINGLKLEAGGNEYIKVAVSANDVDVKQLPQSEQYVQIGMPEFENTKSGQLAPGTYGEIKLYVTALNPVVEGCSIRINSIPEYTSALSGGSMAQGQSVTTEEIEKLIKGHIQFYSKCDVAGNKQRTYSGLITDDSPLMVALEDGVEKEITVYWVWHYEYTDIPAEALTAFASDKTYFFDKDKYSSSNEANYKTADYISFYDYGDTKLGMYVKDVHFHLRVNGVDYKKNTN